MSDNRAQQPTETNNLTEAEKDRELAIIDPARPGADVTVSTVMDDNGEVFKTSFVPIPLALNVVTSKAAVIQIENSKGEVLARMPQPFRAEPKQTELPGTEQPYIYENDDTAFSRGRAVESQTVILDLGISSVTFSVKANPNDVIKSKEAPLINAAEIAEGEEPGEVDTKFLRMSKRLISLDCTKEISSLDSQLKNFVKVRAVPCQMLRGGMHLIPTKLVMDIDAELTRYRIARKALVEKFVQNYEAFKREARESLGCLFDETEYPTGAEIKQRYGVQYRWLSFNISAALKNVNKDLFTREKQRVEAQWEEAADDIRVSLREGLAGLVNHLVEQLKPGEEGKRKQLTSASLEKLNTFLNTFEARNLTNDSELQVLADQARELMKDATIKNIKKDTTFRATLQANLEEVKAGLETMVAGAKTRKISFDDEV